MHGHRVGLITSTRLEVPDEASFEVNAGLRLPSFGVANFSDPKHSWESKLKL